MPDHKSLYAGYPHGQRYRYLAGCRCLPCRAANSRYSCARYQAAKAGDGNPLVPKRRLLARIKLWTGRGVGYKRLAGIAGIAKSTLAKAAYCEGKHYVRRDTEKRILAIRWEDVLAWGGRGFLDAAPTHRQVRWLVANGAKRGWIGRALGNQTATLQLKGKRVSTANAAGVDRLYRSAGGPGKYPTLRGLEEVEP